jgi:hypothetical protein
MWWCCAGIWTLGARIGDGLEAWCSLISAKMRDPAGSCVRPSRVAVTQKAQKSVDQASRPGNWRFGTVLSHACSVLYTIGGLVVRFREPKSAREVGFRQNPHVRARQYSINLWRMVVCSSRFTGQHRYLGTSKYGELKHGT